jgi:surface protein
MNEMFAQCSSLKSLPDISNWNTDNVFEMYDLFEGCTSLELSNYNSINFSRTKIIKMIYENQNNENKIKIINPSYLKKYKQKFIIIYKNKISFKNRIFGWREK